MDAITTLRDDHKRVEKLFKEFEKLEKNDGSATQKKRIVDEIVRELSVHAAIEEQHFYPAVKSQVEEAEDTVLEGLEEHHVVKWTLSELDGMKGDEERFDAKVTVLIESVRHHVEEEEGEMFPKVREAIGRKELQELGQVMDKARASVPAKPQPKAPDEPPANLIGRTKDAPEAKSGFLGRLREKEDSKR
jgi:hemerythrin superfamily protein